MRDNYDLWRAHDMEQERRRARLPVCRICGEHIMQEEAVCIDGDYYCDECLENNREALDYEID